MKLLDIAKKNYRENKKSYFLVWGLCLVEFILFGLSRISWFLFLLAWCAGYAKLITVWRTSMREEVLIFEGDEKDVDSNLRTLFDYSVFQINIYTLSFIFLGFLSAGNWMLLCSILVYLSVSFIFWLIVRSFETCYKIYLKIMIIGYPIWLFGSIGFGMPVFDFLEK